MSIHAISENQADPLLAKAFALFLSQTRQAPAFASATRSSSRSSFDFSPLLFPLLGYGFGGTNYARHVILLNLGRPTALFAMMRLREVLSALVGASERAAEEEVEQPIFSGAMMGLVKSMTWSKPGHKTPTALSASLGPPTMKQMKSERYMAQERPTHLS